MTLLTLGLLSLGVAYANPAQVPQTQATQSPARAADNTAVNTRDGSIVAKTAQNQSINATDAEITRLIRRELTMDNSLSTYAQNVKVVTDDQKVTLRGPVRSEAEKEAVQRKAEMIAGRESVINELDVVTQ